MVRQKIIRLISLIAYVLIIASPVIAIDWLPMHSFGNFLFKIGKSAALIAFSMVVLQVCMTCRLKILDRLFAIDRITNFHKRTGMIVACLLIIHVTFIILGTGNTALLSVDTSWRINLGKAALALAVIIVVLALTYQTFGLDYNIWRVGHKFALAIVLLGFLHSYFIGDEIQDTPLKIYWWILLFVCVAATGCRNVYIPFFGRHPYKVQSVSPQTHNTYTLTFDADHQPIASHQPGQFMFLKLKRPGRKSEIHPFTISCSPTFEQGLQATIKQSGNFTNTIDQTKTSDTAYVEGPYGQFSFLNYPERPILFIAGGVGITPIMSMIRYLRDMNDGRKVVLLYGNQTNKDIIFKEELDQLPENFKVVHILSQAEEGWTGLRGFITKDTIVENATQMFDTAEIFLCGPPPMMDKVVSYLKELYIPNRHIHYERFTL